MDQPNFEQILAAKRDYYGHTEAAIEFAAGEYSRQWVQYELNKNGLAITCPKCITGTVTIALSTYKYVCTCGCRFTTAPPPLTKKQVVIKRKLF